MPDFTAIAQQVAQAAITAEAGGAAEAASGMDAIAASIAVIGASITVIGAAYGISKLSAVANESIARQPEAASKISGNMILTAAFIEGVALFAVVVALLAAL
ncbi:MAG: ATP synthase F0 subunit C [Planctomycetota bacterium]